MKMRLKAVDLNLSGLITGGNGRRLVDLILGAAAIGLLVWLFLIWSEPLAPSIDDGKTAAVPHKAAVEGKAGPRSYSVIVEKDLFSPARRKYVPPKPRPVVVIAIAQGPPPPPPRKAPPRLMLIGTVLLDDGEAAIMEYAGAAQKGAYYRIGDMVEEFAVKEIRKDSVVLERDDGAVLNVTMSSSSPGSPAERSRVNRPQGRSGQSDIPVGLVPSQPAPGAVTPQTPVAPPAQAR